MRLDTEIKRDVEAELAWDPDIDGSDIGVAVKAGVVTLTGFVGSYAEKMQAESVAKRIRGVLGVANDVVIRLAPEHERPDPDIARDIVNTLKSEFPLAADGVRVVVRKRWAWLEGNVEWNHQRARMENAVRRVAGVRGVTNLLALRPRVAPVAIKNKIVEALRRQAAFDADRITVETSGSEVLLKGTVRSWAERQEAERVAWRAPGVTNVDNRLAVAS